jgi:transcriptional regulator with XRE-family HTH domain
MANQKDLNKQFEFLDRLRKNQLTTPNEFTKGMGHLIKQAREDKGISQLELAKELNRRQATISDIENGKSEIGILTLVQFAVYLNKPISYFFPNSLLKEHVLDVKTNFQHKMLERARLIEEFMGNQNTTLDILDVLIKQQEEEFEAAMTGDNSPDLSNEEDKKEG